MTTLQVVVVIAAVAAFGVPSLRALMAIREELENTRTMLAEISRRLPPTIGP